MDIRHKKRIAIVQELYALLFTKKKLLSAKSHEIIKHQITIESQIEKSAPKYELSKIAKVDLSILKLAIYELTIEKKEPPKVIINEAVELAKELAGEKSPGFINAVLGKIYTKITHG